MAKVFEITDALPSGTYELLVEVVDAAGNKLIEASEYVVSVLSKTEEDKKIEEPENEDKLENKLEDKKVTEKQEDSKVEISLPEENASCSNSKRRESKRSYKRTIEREKNYLCYKRASHRQQGSK